MIGDKRCVDIGVKQEMSARREYFCRTMYNEVKKWFEA